MIAAAFEFHGEFTDFTGRFADDLPVCWPGLALSFTVSAGRDRQTPQILLGGSDMPRESSGHH
jgi:hypothetical protein